jgi:hypothetical protein
MKWYFKLFYFAMYKGIFTCPRNVWYDSEAIIGVEKRTQCSNSFVCKEVRQARAVLCQV